MMAVTTSRDPDRLVLFTDAVVAIAITLLVLPLVDAVSESVAEHHTSVQVITENQPKIYTFLLSFAVIAQYWFTHHRMFENVKAYNRTLTLWNLLWLLTIVVLPFPTEMLGAYSDDKFTALLYIGTILASSACLAVMTITIHGNPEIGHDATGYTPRNVLLALIPSTLLVIAFVLASTVPGMTYTWLLLLFLSGPLGLVVRRRFPV
jgi:TMEM175 potassium channel family protein